MAKPPPVPHSPITDLTAALSRDLRRRVANETIAALDAGGERRDLRVAETGSTPRRYCVATRATLLAACPAMPELYRSRELLEIVARAAGEPVAPIPYEPEEFVATRLERAGDTHGWHWDDYAFALVWVLEAPEAEAGGALELVPQTRWCKEHPGVETILAEREVERLHVPAGSVYLLRSATTMHRVAPLRRDARRSVLCFSYASAGDLQRTVSHETVERIFARGAAS